MIRILIIATISLCSILGVGQTKPIETGEIHYLKSTVLNEDRQIAIWTPEDYKNSDKKYPVLYLLDGEWNFRFVSALADKLASSGDIPQIIVVGIINNNRSKDLTPPGPADNKNSFGGGEEFLRFIETELQPWVTSTFRTHPYRILAGHSFGGLFSIYSMMARPTTFHAFIALSPSLGRNNEQAVEQAEEFFNQNTSFAECLYLAVGNEGGYTLKSSQKFNKIILDSPPPKMRYHYENLTNENHVSITTTGFLNGLRFIYEGFNIEELTELDEIFLCEEHYHNLSTRYGYNIRIPEEKYQEFVLEQLALREFDYALFLLEKYKKVYPESISQIYLFATFYLQKGEFKKAKEYYKRLRQQGFKDENTERIWEQLKDF